MSSAVKSWRTAFLTLRDETLESPSHHTVLRLLDQLIYSQHDSLIAAAPELPPHEVTSDVMLLMDLVRNISDFEGIQDDTQPFTKLSNLIHGISHCAVLEMNSTSWALVIDFFRRIVEVFLDQGRTRSVLLRNVAVIKATKQCLESIRRLFCLSHAAASLSENVQLLIFLLQVVGSFQRDSIYSSYFSDDYILSGHDIVWKTLTVAFTVVGEVYSGVGSSLPVDTWESTIEVLSKFMDTLASKSHLVEDKILTKFYIELLHFLHLVIGDPRGYLSSHVL